MILLSAEKLNKSYSERPLLKDCSIGIDQGDKIGIIGANGTGKSTFLKILAGLEFPDSGTVTRSAGIRVAYLPQNPVFSDDATVLEQVMKGVISDENGETTSGQQSETYSCKTILTKLGLLDFDAKISLLSGGQRRRVAMACALASESELLILDEPTNHIDMEAVAWLEKYLARYSGALVMVTHDRYFLDRVTNKIVELQNGSLFTYPANYSQYLELKAQREEMLQASERKRQSLYRKELEWMHQGAKARGTKSRYRLERLEDLENQRYSPDQAKLEMAGLGSRLGKKIVELDRVSKGFDGKLLLQDFSYLMLRGDRVGIIGPNGCGKSTLLNMISGNITPDSGTVVVGDTVKIGYFSQECPELPTSIKAIDAIRSIAQEIKTDDGTLTASQLMEKFLFPSELQYTEVGRLSGGERRRLFLLQILMDAPNILLLDEPTNDLDIETLTVLEDYLSAFPGAVIAVSHDRYFLDKVIDHVFVMNGDGSFGHFLGGYSDYLEEVTLQEKAVKSSSPQEVKERTARPRQGKLKFTFKEAREFEEIDGTIASLEEKLEALQKKMELQSSDYTLLQEATAEKEATEKLLAEKMERWVYLNDLADQIAADS